MLETIIPIVILFLLGAAFGSFFNVCIYRIPRRESIIFPASHCPSCNSKIEPWHNIPILSFIFLKGKCRYCGEKIHWHYWLVEILSPLLFLLIYHVYGFSFITLKYLIFSSFGIVIFFIDLFNQVIPDRLSLPLIALGLILSFIPVFDVSWISAILGSAVGFGFFLLIAYLFQLLTKKEGLGGGDIKLIAGIGAFTGLEGVMITVFVSSFLTIFVMLPLLKNRKKHFPFGPFLIAGAMFYLLFGRQLFALYLNLF